MGLHQRRGNRKPAAHRIRKLAQVWHTLFAALPHLACTLDVITNSGSLGLVENKVLCHLRGRYVRAETFRF
jgi:hypothetical protein